MRLLPALLLLTAACRNAPVDDGAVFGPFTQVKTFFTSAFVAETSEGVVLIDTGYNKKAKQVAKHLEGRGLSLDDVAHVVLTHGHTDHIRALPALPGATVWAHEDEVALVREEGGDEARVDQTVVDGDLLVFGDLTLEVFHVPGHTEGSLALLADGVLLTGDVAMSYKDGTVGPPPERYSGDPAQARRELLALRDRLAERDETLDAVTFSHSEGLTDPAPFWQMDGSAPGQD